MNKFFYIVSLPPFVANAVLWPDALATGAKIMRRRAWRTPNDAGRTHGIVNHGTSLISVVPHRNIVHMIIKMNIRNRHAELIFLGRVERYTVGCLRHIFTDQPHAGHVLVSFHNAREFATPSCKIEAVSEPGSEERQAQVQRLSYPKRGQIAGLL